MLTEKDLDRCKKSVEHFTKEDMENIELDILFMAMVGIIGLDKTKQVLSYYVNLKKELEEHYNG